MRRRRQPTVLGARGSDVHALRRTRPADEQRLALRIAIFGGVALALFVVLFFRLWFLQVLGGEEVPGRGEEQRTRSSGSARRAARSSTATAGSWSPTEPAWRCRSTCRSSPRTRPSAARELARLAELTHRRCGAAPDDPRRHGGRTGAHRSTLRRDVGHSLVYYLQENQDRFPGVESQRVFVRRYPQGTLAAHILGNVGEINEDELKQPRYRGLRAGRPDRPGRGRVHLRPLPARATRG